MIRRHRPALLTLAFLLAATFGIADVAAANPFQTETKAAGSTPAVTRPTPAVQIDPDAGVTFGGRLGWINPLLQNRASRNSAAAKSLATAVSSPAVPAAGDQTPAPGINVQTPAGTGVGVDSSRVKVQINGRTILVPRRGNPAERSVPGAEIGSALGDVAEMTAALREFARARQAFRASDYPSAESLVERALKQSPRHSHLLQLDSLLHFAQNDYDRAAAAAYDGISAGQLWDWATVAGHFSDPSLYTRQYQDLMRRAAAGDAPARLHFLLAYHHLMLGHADAAAGELEHVERLMPGDPIVAKLRAVLTSARQPLPPAPSIQPPAHR